MRDIPINGVPAFINLRQHEVPVKRGYVRRRTFLRYAHAYIKGMRLALDESSRRRVHLEAQVTELIKCILDRTPLSRPIIVSESGLVKYREGDVKLLTPARLREVEHQNAILTDAFVALQDIADRLRRLCQNFRINDDSKITVRFELEEAGRDLVRALAASPMLSGMRTSGDPVVPSQIAVNGVLFTGPEQNAMSASEMRKLARLNVWDE